MTAHGPRRALFPRITHLGFKQGRLLPILVVAVTCLSLWKRFGTGPTRYSGKVQPRIPKILHHVSRSEMVYTRYQMTVKSCIRLNPDWTYVLWRDEDAESLIKEFFPTFYRYTYLQYTDPLQKSDSIRYIVLYLFGGVLQGTGPLMLDEALNDWTRQPANRAAEDSVRLMDPEVFSPYVDNKEILMRHCKLYATKQLIASTPNRGLWIARGCKRAFLVGLKDNFSERTLAVHWFMHLGWYSQHERARLKIFNISRLARPKFFSGADGAELRKIIDLNSGGIRLHFA